MKTYLNLNLIIMKKSLLALVAGLFSLLATGQNFTITGTVMYNSGGPVANHPVYIYADSTVFNYYNVVYTDAFGNYMDVITNGAQIGPNIDFLVTAETCNGNYNTITLANNQGTVTSGVATFTVCDSNGTGNCNSNFVNVSLGQGMYDFAAIANHPDYTYYWSYGDGAYGTGQSTTHFYSQNGTYTACLYVDSAGVCSSTTCQTIVVTNSGNNNGCIANFFWFADSLNNSVYLINNSSGGMLMTYAWDFGDGNTGTGQVVSHNYANYGTYLVCLTISDGAGCTATYCDSIAYTLFQGQQNRSGFTLNIVLAGPTGIVEEIKAVDQLSIYPNPTSGEFNLTFESTINGNVEILITDIVGKVVMNETTTVNTGSVKLNYNLSDYNNGMYIMNIRDIETGAIQSLRFIKQ